MLLRVLDMALKRIRLGNYIEPLKEKCGIANLDPYEVSGVNRDKEFFKVQASYKNF